MTRQQKLIQLPLIGTVLLSLLAGVYLLAWKRFSKPRIKKHSVKTSSDEALKYWTADKMHNAKPAKLPNVNDRTPGKQHPQSSSSADA
jgi:hypothetical protein